MRPLNTVVAKRDIATTTARWALLLCLVGSPLVVVAQVKPEFDLAAARLEAVRAQYRADEWPKGATRDGFPLAAFVLEGWRGSAFRSDAGHLKRVFRRTEKSEVRSGFLIESFVAENAQAAHKVLLTWLAERQAPTAAEAARDRDIDVGDVGFLAVSQGDNPTLLWIAFVRGNVAVRVANVNARVQPKLDLATISGKIDATISERKALPAGATPPRATISKLVSAKRKATAGDVIRLDAQVVDPGGGTPHLQWVVGGAGQGYVEKQDDGAWYLFTTGSGKITLILEVTASTGTFTTKSIELSVGDD